MNRVLRDVTEGQPGEKSGKSKKGRNKAPSARGTTPVIEIARKGKRERGPGKNAEKKNVPGKRPLPRPTEQAAEKAPRPERTRKYGSNPQKSGESAQGHSLLRGRERPPKKRKEE